MNFREHFNGVLRQNYILNVISLKVSIYALSFTGASIVSNAQRQRHFLDTDARTRSKRNVTSYDDVNSDVSSEKTNLNIVSVSNVSSSKQWKKDLLSGKYYGAEQYMQRKLFKDHPNRGKLKRQLKT